MSIYLDYQATTPVDPEVLAAMQPYWDTHFANPHSQHRSGWQAAAAVDLAREAVAELVGATPEWCVFTSGATEANNLALKGVMQAAPASRRRLVTVATEHSCVLESAKALEAHGYTLTVLPVVTDGLLDMDIVKGALDDSVALISVMAVNNEIGVIQPLEEIGRLARDAGALFHTDAAQAFGKIPLNVEQMRIDLLSISAHKIYGPKGAGALLVRPGTPLAPQMHGGGQEGRGLRSGTLAPALVAGLGRAAMLAKTNMSADADHVDRLWDVLLARLPRPHHINGCIDARWHGNLNVAFPGVDGARLLSDLKSLSVSSGAACASAAGRHSHVLDAIGLDRALARASLRMGWGRFSKEAEIEEAADMIDKAVAVQRALAA